ncbi:unnamed protein product [Prunus brigantina]
MILYKVDDALIFKEFAFIFTKEYTSYRTVKKHADHLFNLRKKPDKSLRDYLKRFKAEKGNIIGCNDLKVSKQATHPTRQANQKSNKFEHKARDKRRSQPQEGGSETGTFTEFTIPIHQILAQRSQHPTAIYYPADGIGAQDHQTCQIAPTLMEPSQSLWE